MNVVLVEDNEAYRELVAMALTDYCGAGSVLQYESARAALRDISEWGRKAGLILLDFHLGGSTAPQLMRSIRSHGCTAPIAVVSGAASDQEKAQCVQEGALSVVTKPFGLDALVGTLDSLLRLETRRRPGTTATAGHFPRQALAGPRLGCT